MMIHPSVSTMHFIRLYVLCTKKLECNTLYKGFCEDKDIFPCFHVCYVTPTVYMLVWPQGFVWPATRPHGLLFGILWTKL